MNAAVNLAEQGMGEKLTVNEIRQAFAMAGCEKELQDFNALVSRQETLLSESVNFLTNPASKETSRAEGGVDYVVNEKAKALLAYCTEIAVFDQMAREILDAAEMSGEILAPRIA